MKIKTPLALASQLLKNLAQDVDNLEASSRLKNIDVGVFLNVERAPTMTVTLQYDLTSDKKGDNI